MGSIWYRLKMDEGRNLTLIVLPYDHGSDSINSRRVIEIYTIRVEQIMGCIPKGYTGIRKKMVVPLPSPSLSAHIFPP